MTRSGAITAHPNPIFPRDSSRVVATTLEWTSTGAETAEIRVGAPDGPLLCRGGMSGSATTGEWVIDGMTFYLQDVSTGLPLSDSNTLAKVVVNVGSLDTNRPDDVPRVGHVDFGGLRRTTPISREWGSDRGRPVDRYYVEKFLRRHAADIHGRVVGIGDGGYTRLFGGDRVSRSDVLTIETDNPEATLVADLADAPQLSADTFDCMICPQTLQLIYDLPAAIRTTHRILKPGGIVLATVPGITHIGDARWAESWCWSLTRSSATRLFGEAFGAQNVQVVAYGNVLAAISFLVGLADHELRHDELDEFDPAYEVVIGVRAVKSR
jgi:SAM-dependent methyltransferase